MTHIPNKHQVMTRCYGWAPDAGGRAVATVHAGPVRRADVRGVHVPG
ncbi:MAG: hypothetical protein ABIR58_09335 [Gemmatimonadaceae bacterium]